LVPSSPEDDARAAESPRSETSIAAMECAASVPAGRGAHKRAARGTVVEPTPAEDLVRRRIWTKKSEGVMKRPAQASAAPSVQVVIRRNPPERREAYIMHGGSYLLGLREKTHAKYLDIVSVVATELSTHLLQSQHAKKRMQELASSM